MPLVGLITIWYRASKVMDRFLENLRELEYPRVQPVFVIHSQSPDEVRRLRDRVPGAIVLEPGANLGTAAGWNLGVSPLLELGADYVGIWNVDVSVAPDYLTRLVEVMEADPGIGACQPLLFYSDEPDKVQMFGGSYDPRKGLGGHDYSGATDLSALPPVRDADYLDGGTMLVRAEALRCVGGFDERFFMYWEDTDICLRLRRAGYRTIAVRDARVWHYHREDRGRFPPAYQLYYWTRNEFQFVRKHADRAALRRLTLEMLWRSPRTTLRYVRRGKVPLAIAYLSGVAQGMAGLDGKRGWIE